MIKLDSIKFKLQSSNLCCYASNHWNTSILLEPDGFEQVKYILRQDKIQHIGLKRVEILPFTQEVIVECSSKILQEQYLDGINKDTIERLSDVVGEYIELSVYDVADSQLLRADITENLYFPTREEKLSVMRALKLGKSNTGFKVDDWTDKNGSIVFTGRQKSYKNRQIYYPKEEELLLARNKDILSILRSHGVKDIDKILRVEQNITSIDRLRRAVGMEKGVVTLGDMLSSTRKPLLERHIEIMKYADLACLFNEDMDIIQIRNLVGWKGIFEKCNGCGELVEDLIKLKAKSRASAYRYIKEFRTHASNSIVSFVSNLRNPDDTEDYQGNLLVVKEMLAAS